MKQLLCLPITIILLLAGCQQNELYRTIGEKEFTELSQRENVIILDVRTPSEYSQGHLKNAVLIDYKNENFETEINKLDKSKTYLVYCKSGGRSAKASKVLSEKGFSVCNLNGGISDWTGEIVP